MSRTEWDSTNAALRFGAQQTDHSERIDKFIREYGVSLEENIKGYRGAKGMTYPTEVGTSFTDKGYFRFSGDAERAEIFAPENRDVQYVTIKIPAGTSILPGHHTFEQEAFLPRGTQYRVVSVKKIENGEYYSHGEMAKYYRYEIELEVIK
ncbi:MAG: hypothetical protein NUV97_00660 [archaeon]|nr:hypothetical protein [archaeon]